MDVPAAIRSLDLSREDDAPDLGWLTQSHQDPPAFWAALTDHARRAAPGLRTSPGAAIDLYHDLIGRNVSERPALITFDRRAGWRSTSFADVASRASACAAAWAALGLAPGAIVAITLPIGPSWLVALAAALRLGLVIAPIDPTGKDTLAARLKALSPARVIIDPAAPPDLGPLAEKALSVIDGGPAHGAAPHAYGPKAPCALLFSPLRAPPNVPVPLPAEMAWQNALRDGLFAYRLPVGSSGGALAIPGLSLQQTQPAAIFAAFLAGATFVHASMDDLEQDPSILGGAPITTLGISAKLRDAIRKKPFGKLPAEHWFRAVEEPLDYLAWKDLVTKAKAEKMRGQNLLIDAASGGAVLFSTRRPGSINAYALPAAGRAYSLCDLQSGEPTTAGVGVFVPKPGDPKHDGWFLLAARSTEFLWAGPVAPRRDGHVFPATELSAFTGALEGVAGAAVVPLPGGEAGRWSFTLVVFTGASPGPSQEAIAAAIEAHLAPGHAPDAVVTFPLFPRKKGKEVDAEWAARQYSSGTLARKAAHPVFRKLTALFGLLAGAPKEP